MHKGKPTFVFPLILIAAIVAMSGINYYFPGHNGGPRPAVANELGQADAPRNGLKPSTLAPPS